MNALAPVVSGKEVSQHRCDECRSRVWSVECARREHDVCMACAGRGAGRGAGRVRGACFAGARVIWRLDLSLQRQLLNELQLLVRWWYPLQPAGPSAASKRAESCMPWAAVARETRLGPRWRGGGGGGNGEIAARELASERASERERERGARSGPARRDGLLSQLQRARCSAMKSEHADLSARTSSGTSAPTCVSGLGSMQLARRARGAPTNHDREHLLRESLRVRELLLARLLQVLRRGATRASPAERGAQQGRQPREMLHRAEPQHVDVDVNSRARASWGRN